jgi:hypothetical protein
MKTFLKTGAMAGLLLAGCGEWVQYEEEPVEPPQVVTPGADSVDEDTRDTYASLTQMEHLIFEGLLAQYIVDNGDGYTFVDYAGLEARPESRALLDQYLAILDLVDPAQLESSAERQAYWYNAYNAATLRGVLDLWEGDPEWSVAEGFFAFFDFEIWSFGGVVMSLNQLEHGVLRGDFDHDRLVDLPPERIAVLRERFENLWEGGELDPRLHMAINCASYSCPNLAATAPYAFRAETLDAQLEALVGAFLANPIKGAGPDGISSLFNWFAEDWSLGGYDGPADFIAKHREGGIDGVDLDNFLFYDWTLNVVPSASE